jgi:pimeloyl-ACP methyl ester carboxylesterase
MPFLQAKTHRLHYADSHPDGSPSGLTFIFIHGLGSSQNYYFPVIPHLTEHRCITLDTYGSARSPYTNDTVSIPSIAEDVIGALDALNVAKAVVVGHSMGGLVVTELGARYPDRVAGVVAIGPTHPSEMLVSVMSKRADTVLECTYFPKRFLEKSTNCTSRNGTNGQYHPLRRRRIPQHPAPEGVYPGARARSGS